MVPSGEMLANRGVAVTEAVDGASCRIACAGDGSFEEWRVRSGLDPFGDQLGVLDDSAGIDVSHPGNPAEVIGQGVGINDVDPRG